MGISSSLGSSALLPAGLGFRNVLINGDFKVWQRSTSAAISAGSYVAADRWYTYRSVAGSTFSRQTASLVGFQYSGRIARDSGNTSTVNISCGQSIESNNSIPLAGQTVVFSFWAKAGANYSATSSILRVRLLSSTTTDQNIVLNGGVTVIDQNVTLTTSWQRFSYSAVVGSTAVTLGTIFSYDPTGTAGAADHFEITGVQLEQNYQPTPFEQRPIGVELALCQRYFYRFVGSSSNYNSIAACGVCTSATNLARGVIVLPVPMRRSIFTADLTFAASSLMAYDGLTLQFITAITVYGGSQNQYITSDVTCNSGLTVGNPGAMLTYSGVTTGLSISTEL